MSSIVRAVLGACGVLVGTLGFAACGSSEKPTGENGEAADAGASDAKEVNEAGNARDASLPREERATGRRIVARPASLAGLTSDGYAVFSDVDSTGHAVAKVIALDGTGETTLTASSGTGKSDLRFEIRGRVVFVWADRANRMGTLTLWSKATGVVVKGPGARPGRAAATADGMTVAYLRDITAETATIVAGPIAGSATVLGTINAQDDACWRDVDLTLAGEVTPRLLMRYCPSGTTSFALRTAAPDGSSSLDLSGSVAEATYGSKRVVWRETSGALRSASPDGNDAVTLAPSAAAYRVSRDGTLVAFRTAGSEILSVPTDGASAPALVVAAPDGKQLGAISANNQNILFASRTEDRGAGHIALYTNVKIASLADGGGTSTLVEGTTSCPSCLYDSFTPDTTFALVLDPIDNSERASGVGTLRVFAVANGAPQASLGAHTFTALALGKGTGASSRFLFVDALPDPLLVTGYAYGLTTRSLEASEPATTVARGAEQLAVDAARANVVFSFAGAGANAGIWVAPLP